MTSTVTAFTPIPERSDATPGLWNSRFQQLQDNQSSAVVDLIGWNKGSVSTTVDFSAGTLSTNTIRAASGNTIRIPNGQSLIVRSIDSGGRSWDLRAFGGVCNGIADDTSAITSAINAAANAGGGVVTMPRGTVLFTSGFTIADTVELRGAGIEATFLSIGSNLCGTDSGITAPALINMGNNSKLRLLAIQTELQPQIKSGTTSPVKHNWAVGHRGTGNTVIEDVRLTSLWRGISGGAELGPGTGVELMHLNRVTGCCLKDAFYVDQATDVVRIENTHIHPNYSLYYDNPASANFDLASLLVYLRTNQASVLRMRRADWAKVHDCVSYGYYQGLVLELGTNYASGRAQVSFSNCGWDGAQYGAVISDCVSARFTNSTFAVRRNAAETPVYGVDIAAGNTSSVGFVNCEFQAEVSDRLLNLTGAATVAVDDSYFISEVLGVVASAGRLQFNNNTFGFLSGAIADITLSGSATISGTGNRRADGTALVLSGCSAAGLGGLFETSSEVESPNRIKAVAGTYTGTVSPVAQSDATTKDYATLAANASYLVWAHQDAAAGFHASAHVHTGASTLTWTPVVSRGMSISQLASSLSIGVLNSSGGTITVGFGYQRLYHS